MLEQTLQVARSLWVRKERRSPENRVQTTTTTTTTTTIVNNGELGVQTKQLSTIMM